MNTFTLVRTDNGIITVRAEDLPGLYAGLGFAHAMDRGMQMIFMRTLGQGRVGELFDSSDSSLAIDTFFRRMNWRGGMEDQAGRLSDTEAVLIDAYCGGANRAFTRKYPWELKLLKVPFEQWTPEDSFLVARMTGYLTLAQSQGEMERFFIEMVQAGISPEKLRELFPMTAGAADFDLMKEIKLGERLVPAGLWKHMMPRIMASNNWAVSGSATATGKPILANDPHLEVNRLPNIWYEIILETGDRHFLGATMPGLPGLIAGRTNDLAWGVTYSFMDATDSWVERCENGSFYRSDKGWVPFRKRTEAVKRRKKAPVEITFYENDHGVLDGDPNVPGNYLATRWSGSVTGAVSLASMAGMFTAASAAEAMDLLGPIETAWNWIIADNDGNIAYQMSGLLPKRAKGVNGFVPMPGWEKRYDWKGYYPHTDLPRSLNPEEGFLLTSNNDLNYLGKTDPINLPMGPYRADRIAAMLKAKITAGELLIADDMKQMQADLYSEQAERFMDLLRPLLPEGEPYGLLHDWDCRYNAESKGAFLFEEWYRQMRLLVFNENGFGLEAGAYIEKETGLYADFYYNFDAILLSEHSAWFGGKTRDEIYMTALVRIRNLRPEKWGKRRKIVFSHILFGGKMPRFLGFDRGPVTMQGGRASIFQGQIFKSAGRMTTFAPSFCFVTDLAEPGYHSILAGGASDRRFSRWYANEIGNWLRREYKRLKPNSSGIKINVK